MVNLSEFFKAFQPFDLGNFVMIILESIGKWNVVGDMSHSI